MELKTKCCAALALAITATSTQTLAADCLGMAKPISDLQYMTADELSKQYCSADSWYGIAMRGADKETAAGYPSRAMEMLEDARGCYEYQDRIVRVLKKDHGRPTPEC